MIAALIPVILPILLPLILKVIDMFLDKNEKASIARKFFLQWIDALAADGIISAKLHESYASQREKNRLELEKGGNP